MITITINRSQAELIESFTISGHAGFAKRGEDVVCAGVSAVSIGIVNAIESLTKIEPNVELREDGYLHYEIPYDVEKTVMDKIQILLEAMLVSLQTIQVEYEKYVRIKINH